MSDFGAAEGLSPPPDRLTTENLQTLTPPAHEEAGRASDDGSVLSDIDDEIFKDFDDSVIGKVVPIDEETVRALGKYKKKHPGTGELAGGKKEKRRRDIKRRRTENDGDAIGAQPEEPVLTAEESE